MSFNSIEFLFRFLPIFLVAYYATPSKYRNLTLIVGSFIFYAFGSGWYLLLLILSVFINFIISRFLVLLQQKHNSQAKSVLVIGLFYNFGLLAVFKYLGFLVENLNTLLAFFFVSLPVPEITMPLGISFYTFQITSYLFDIYYKKTKPARSILELCTYMCMFPNLISGPIATFGEMQPQLQKRQVNIKLMENGLRLFVLGLGAKMILSNPMGGLWNNLSVIGYDYISTPYAWLGIFAYTFQLYFDFSGYSMMAIGVGMMLGLELPQNFNLPYCSGSVGEFWRRWHMTLGRWFRNYIYIPLGGNRHGTWKTIRNMLAVWAFTGLWHGASWNYVLWGLTLFVLLILERFFYGKWLERTHILKHLYLLLVIPLTWMIFAIPDLHEMGEYFLRLFPFLTSDGVRQNFSDFTNAFHDYWKILLPCVFFCTPIPVRYYQKYQKSGFCSLLLVLIFAYSIYQMTQQTSNPFLYFQF